MGLPTVDDLSKYLRLDPPTAALEGQVLNELLTDALGFFQEAISRPVAATPATFMVNKPSRTTPDKPVFSIPAYPLDPATVVVTDRFGNTVDPRMYQVDVAKGLFRRGPIGSTPTIQTFGSTVLWDLWPYTVAVTWGLATAPDYATTIEPSVRRALLDLAADWYQNRNPAARSETAGGGISVTVLGVEIPPRVAGTIARLRRVPRAW